MIIVQQQGSDTVIHAALQHHLLQGVLPVLPDGPQVWEEDQT